VWECGEGQTDTQMVVTNIHFASATPHANCNENRITQVYLENGHHSGGGGQKGHGENSIASENSLLHAVILDP